MADIADLADEYQQSRLDAAIKTSNNLSKQLNIEGSGFCLDCGMSVEPVEINGKNIVGRFCCIECRDAYDKYQKLFR